MFGRLPKLETGDLIFVDVLGQTLACKVVSTLVDTPEAGMEHLQVQPDKDLLTLVTCTPYGVSTHRLLVTAERTEVEVAVSADSAQATRLCCGCWWPPWRSPVLLWS